MSNYRKSEIYDTEKRTNQDDPDVETATINLAIWKHVIVTP